MIQGEKGRVEVTTAEVAYLTLGSWAAVTIGSEVKGCYCDSCDDIEAVLVVQDYYLSLTSHGISAEGACKRCGEEMLCTYAILNPQLIQDVLTMGISK